MVFAPNVLKSVKRAMRKYRVRFAVPELASDAAALPPIGPAPPSPKIQKRKLPPRD
jgi:hypothetical protein